MGNFSHITVYVLIDLIVVYTIVLFLCFAY